MKLVKYIDIAKRILRRTNGTAKISELKFKTLKWNKKTEHWKNISVFEQHNKNNSFNHVSTILLYEKKKKNH